MAQRTFSENGNLGSESTTPPADIKFVGLLGRLKKSVKLMNNGRRQTAGRCENSLTG
jgi:hypothetical protein